MDNQNKEPEKRTDGRANGRPAFFKGLAAGLIIAAVAGAILFYTGSDGKERRIRRLITENAITDATDEDITAGKYKGMLEALGDPYAAYYTKEETEENQKLRSGSYEGVGLSIAADADGQILVVSVEEN